MSLLLRVEEAALVRGGRLLFERLGLTLAAGEAAHVTGPNGSGKSSLIRMVAGLLRPSAGRVERAAAALADHGLALDRELPLGVAVEERDAAEVAEGEQGSRAPAPPVRRGPLDPDRPVDHRRERVLAEGREQMRQDAIGERGHADTGLR